VEVTPEMRRAVYEQDCRDRGHLLAYENAMQLSGSGGQVIGPNGQQAHIECRRCGKVWLVVEEPGEDYTAATVALDAKLQPQHRPVRVKPPETPALPTPTLPGLSR
jgi:hypothetical protein